jgi:dTDP-4-amino-4,6-dideoxygalactose transaminase
MSIPFSPPRIDDKIISEVVDTLKSGWITTGPKTKLFEKKLTEYTGAKSTLCLNSATAGLELMLRWYGVGPEDEVILPAYTYSATANVVVHCGAKLVFVDVNDDFNISVLKIKEAITERTKVIMPVDFGGWPCDYEEIFNLIGTPEIQNKFVPNAPNQEKLGRILVLADAAHSIGAEYKGKKSGSIADISVISFHAVKNLTTAEGGAVCLNLPPVFDNELVYKELCIKSLHGQNKDALAKTKPGAWRYDIIEAGYKFNMTDILASIGFVELARYESDTLVRRKQICEKYSEALCEYSWSSIPVQKNDEKTSSYHLYPLRIKNITEDQRDRIIAKISEKEVAVNVHFIPVPMMSFYKGIGYNVHNYPVTFDNYSREISLPVFYDMTDEQVDIVIKAIIESVEEFIN